MLDYASLFEELHEPWYRKDITALLLQMHQKEILSNLRDSYFYCTLLDFSIILVDHEDLQSRFGISNLVWLVVSIGSIILHRGCGNTTLGRK